MLYNHLAIDELERVVYIDPANAAARAELVARVPDLIDEDSEELADAKTELEDTLAAHKCELDGMREDLDCERAHAAQVAGELDRANAALQVARNERDQALRRIEELTARVNAITACGDLV